MKKRQMFHNPVIAVENGCVAVVVGAVIIGMGIVDMRIGAGMVDDDIVDLDVATLFSLGSLCFKHQPSAV